MRKKEENIRQLIRIIEIGYILNIFIMQNIITYVILFIKLLYIFVLYNMFFCYL